MPFGKLPQRNAISVLSSTAPRARRRGDGAEADGGAIEGRATRTVRRRLRGRHSQPAPPLREGTWVVQEELEQYLAPARLSDVRGDRLSAESLAVASRDGRLPST